MSFNIKAENPLYLTWHNRAWMQSLNHLNILDYFCQESNPFYDVQCNNEIVKVQNRTLDQLSNMVGIEYTVLHAQEPILYVIRKQHRQSPNAVTPLANYYIIGGIVYQAPDLSSLVNARLLNATTNLASAFEKVKECIDYNSTSGYQWRDSTKIVKPTSGSKRGSDSSSSVEPKNKAAKQNDPSSKPTSSTSKTNQSADKLKMAPSYFQAHRVDLLLSSLTRKFPPKLSNTAVASDSLMKLKTEESEKPQTS